MGGLRYQIISKQRSTRMHCTPNHDRDIWQIVFVNWNSQKPNSTWLFLKIRMPILLYSTITVFAVWIVQQVYRRNLLTSNFPVQEQSESQFLQTFILLGLLKNWKMISNVRTLLRYLTILLITSRWSIFQFWYVIFRRTIWKTRWRTNALLLWKSKRKLQI
jgi:hypothetical protein